jgi:hypothetical protein
MQTPTHRKRYLVIDDAHILEMGGLQRSVNQAVKRPEPVILTDAPWNGKNDSFNGMNMIYDEEENLFKMWYTVMTYGGELADGPRKLAYATSRDGINFERPELGIIEVNGSKKNNYLTPAFDVTPAIIKDPSDIPERRYKMIFYLASTEMTWARFHVPLNLAYSSDGIRWERPAHVNPVLRGISDACFNLIYDSDRRKYLLFTRRVPNLPRDISLYESYDLVTWEDKGRVLVPGDEHDPPELYNFYYMAPFRYEDFFLGMVCTQYTDPISETYESFNRSPDYPNTVLGHVGMQLACSRDGRSWHRPIPRSEVVSWGPEGSQDYGSAYPCHNPIVRDGETYIYYSAQKQLHSWWHVRELWDKHKSAQHIGAGMLAKMPEDHWVSLEADSHGGWMLTKPLGFATEEKLDSGSELLVNADAGGGSIEGELITPFGQVVEGLGRGDCIPVTSDGKDQPLRWKNIQSPGEIIAKHLGGLCLKIYLKNAKLYSYTTYKSDPGSKLAQLWTNSRWSNIIKHKSDNWDRLSTEPARGLPPHSGPGPEKGQEKPGEMVLDF